MLPYKKENTRERSQRLALNFSIMYYSGISRKITTRMVRQQPEGLNFAMQKIKRFDIRQNDQKITTSLCFRA